MLPLLGSFIESRIIFSLDMCDDITWLSLLFRSVENNIRKFIKFWADIDFQIAHSKMDFEIQLHVAVTIFMKVPLLLFLKVVVCN